MMETKLKPELSLDYIISQLVGLDFSLNNEVIINNLAVFLNLDFKTIALIYTILYLERVIQSGEDLNFQVINSKLNLKLMQFKRHGLFTDNSSEDNIMNRKLIDRDLKNRIKDLQVMIVRSRTKNSGFKSLLSERFKSGLDQERREILDSVLLENRAELNEYLDQIKFSTLTERRFNILTKLLLNNPEEPVNLTD